jgi:hypothetical protein
MAGHVLIENNTGHAIHVFGCLSLFQVLLTSSTYRPTVAWAACLQRFTIPDGETRYPVTVWASYSQCSQGRPQHGLRPCLPGGRIPPSPWYLSRQALPSPHPSNPAFVPTWLVGCYAVLLPCRACQAATALTHASSSTGRNASTTAAACHVRSDQG